VAVPLIGHVNTSRLLVANIAKALPAQKPSVTRPGPDHTVHSEAVFVWLYLRLVGLERSGLHRVVEQPAQSAVLSSTSCTYWGTGAGQRYAGSRRENFRTAAAGRHMAH
jgi:hypothetical protein